MVAFTNEAGLNGSGFLPPDVIDPVIVRPVLAESVAAAVSKQMQTANDVVVVPRIERDPQASWTAEGSEIAVSNMEVSDLTIRPRKIAGLSVISRELADDSSPDAAALVGSGLARDIVRQIDAAFFGDLEEPAPKGLAGLAGTTEIKAGASFTSLDPFIDAMQAANSAGHPLTAYVANPTDVATLAKLKKATGSIERLLTTERDATGRLVRHIDGVPLMASPAVAEGTIWGIPSDVSLFVRHTETRVELSDQHFFSSDRIAIRAIMRLGWGFIAPASVMKITATT